ncbi:hypothetical protein [Candidatus Laterigemmans baculatus]|uniref:hypothetical protein n=1 Tax=Candidatus Laterigemmans baculatus TaxID=2770505 RepID=UPI0013DA5307|nr:hypothetical protein [Candidatus Laterigemmans baculatus]
MRRNGWSGMLGSTVASWIMVCAILAVPLQAADEREADEPVFSGPQVGEPLPALPVQLVLAEDPTKQVDLTSDDADSPRLVVFVHVLTRPSVGFTRILGEYAASRQRDGLKTAVVFLGEDPTELAERVRRARHALPKNVTIGISPAGAEGPGAYGLNRNVTLTVLVADEGRVTANFALIDPSLPVELPQVLRAICDVVGGQPPTVESLLQAAGQRPGMRMRSREGTPRGEQSKVQERAQPEEEAEREATQPEAKDRS